MKYRSKPKIISSKMKIPRDPDLIYSGMNIPIFKDKLPKLAKKSIATAGVESRAISDVRLQRSIDYVKFVQDPYTDGTLRKLEAAVRRNFAVRTALTVREHFAFGRASKIVIELNESDKLDKNETEQAEEIEKLTKSNIETLKKITDLDERVELVKNVKGPFYWQNLIFGRGIIMKLYKPIEMTQISQTVDTDILTGLTVINTRRLGYPILDSLNNMKFEGVYVDGQPLDRMSMIYGTYNERQISPYTEYFGYSAIEPIVHIAEEHNIVTEEDIKEILKSAWLKSILFLINTAGLSSAEATTQITTLIDSIDPGKYIGANSDVKEAIPLDLEPDFAGIISLVDSLESKIFKALYVPQFLVQSEDMANRATANKSASLFIDGIIAYDQEWLSDILWKQWYEPLLRKELKLEKNPDDQTKDPPPIPFKIKRLWDKPTIEEFLDLAEALKQLKEAGIWDIEQVNKILKTPEVAKRIKAEEEKQKANMPTLPVGNPNANPNANPNQNKNAMGNPNLKNN